MTFFLNHSSYFDFWSPMNLVCNSLHLCNQCKKFNHDLIMSFVTRLLNLHHYPEFKHVTSSNECYFQLLGLNIQYNRMSCPLNISLLAFAKVFYSRTHSCFERILLLTPIFPLPQLDRADTTLRHQFLKQACFTGTGGEITVSKSRNCCTEFRWINSSGKLTQSVYKYMNSLYLKKSKPSACSGRSLKV